MESAELKCAELASVEIEFSSELEFVELESAELEPIELDAAELKSEVR